MPRSQRETAIADAPNFLPNSNWLSLRALRKFAIFCDHSGTATLVRVRFRGIGVPCRAIFFLFVGQPFKPFFACGLSSTVMRTERTQVPRGLLNLRAAPPLIRV